MDLKYVNVADIIGRPVNIALPDRLRRAETLAADGSPDARMADPAPMFDLIELFFFAYRDFVSDADRLLAVYGFGRAHHRVLHFVTRQPGMTIAGLLDILRITKQSLNRVMKDLVDQDFIELRPGVSDRRHRLLFATAKGRRLAHDLAAAQSRRFERVLAGLPPGARDQACQFLLAVIDERDRAAVWDRVAPPLAIAGS